jgi:hypothetical protein
MPQASCMHALLDSLADSCCVLLLPMQGGGQGLSIEPSTMVWLLQRDFLQGKSVQQVVDQALAQVGRAGALLQADLCCCCCCLLLCVCALCMQLKCCPGACRGPVALLHSRGWCVAAMRRPCGCPGAVSGRSVLTLAQPHA